MQRFVRTAWWSCQHCRQQLAPGSKEKQKAPDFLDPMYVGREVVHVPVPRETTDHLVWEQSTWTSFCVLSFKYPPFHLEAQLHFCMHKAQLVLFWETSPQYLRKFDYFWEILSRSKKEKDHAVKEVLCLSHASQSMRRRNHLALSPEWTCNCLSQRFRGKVFTYAFPQTLNVTFVCRPPPHTPSLQYIHLKHQSQHFAIKNSFPSSIVNRDAAQNLLFTKSKHICTKHSVLFLRLYAILQKYAL